MGKSVKRSYGAGIGMPGFVNTRSGINSTYLPTNSKGSLRDFLERQSHACLHRKMISSVLALAELEDGTGKRPAGCYGTSVSAGASASG